MSDEHDDGVEIDEGPAVTSTPSRAAFLSTGTADFVPPDWACMPLEANMHARLEAFRDSRHCATYMISTKKVNVFGRDQDSCDHVLGNPSVSRKHAAIIHDATGGIYIVDLMSRHGTYVGKKKLPPHDPYLLHEGDSIKFGQSIRVYIIKGVTAEGASAPVKKSWSGRVKLKAPKVSISAVLPKMSTKPKYSAPVVKLVGDICYGYLTDEKTEAFITAVMELTDEEKKEVADLLVEKVYAKFEFYAAHVHRNAFVLTATLLKRNLLVTEFEGNLGIITQLSQQRHESIYRSDARKLLQLLAAVRLDPDNVHSPTDSYSVNDSDSVDNDSVNTCPPTSSNMATRERVLSGEGKRLFLAGHGYAPPPSGHGSGSGHPLQQRDGGSRKSTMDEYDLPQHSRQGSYGSTQYDDDDHEDPAGAQNNNGGGYQPPVTCGGGGHGNTYRPPTSAPASNGGHHQHQHYQQPTHSAPPSSQPSGPSSSAFSFMAGTAPTPQEASSAFGFISSSGHDDEDDDEQDTGRPSATGFDFIKSGTAVASATAAMAGPPLPRVRADLFLVETPNVDDRDEFEAMWESTNESEEWEVELSSAFDQNEFHACLEASRIQYIASDKVAGMQRLLFCAEQRGKDTVFLVEVMLMPGLSGMTVTFKCIVNSLLYENGHELFIELFKYTVQRFISTEETPRPRRASTTTTVTSEYTSRPTIVHMTLDQEEEEDDDDEEEEDEEMPVMDYLTDKAMIDPAKFEQLWASASVIGTLSSALQRVPEKDEVLGRFAQQRLSCLASGQVHHLFKFYFYGEMIELQCLFCIEMVLDVRANVVTSTVKRFAPRPHPDQATIDTSFVGYFESIAQSF